MRKQKDFARISRQKERDDFIADDDFWNEVLIPIPAEWLQKKEESSPDFPSPEPIPDPEPKEGTPEYMVELIKELEHADESDRNQLLDEWLEKDLATGWRLVSILLQVDDASLTASLHRYLATKFKDPNRTLLKHLENLLLVPEDFTSDAALSVLDHHQFTAYIKSGLKRYQDFLLNKALAIQTYKNEDLTHNYLKYQALYNSHHSEGIDVPKAGIFDPDQKGLTVMPRVKYYPSASTHAEVLEKMKIPWLEEVIKKLRTENGYSDYEELSRIGLKLSVVQYQLGRFFSLIEFLDAVLQLGESIGSTDDGFGSEVHSYNSKQTTEKATSSIYNLIALATDIGKDDDAFDKGVKLINENIPVLATAMESDLLFGLKRVEREMRFVLYEKHKKIKNYPVWADKYFKKNAGPRYEEVAIKIKQESEKLKSKIIGESAPTDLHDFNTYVQQIQIYFEEANTLYIQSIVSQNMRLVILFQMSKWNNEVAIPGEIVNTLENNNTFKQVFNDLFNFLEEFRSASVGETLAITLRLQDYLDASKNPKMARVQEIVKAGEERAAYYKKVHGYVVITLSIIASIYASFAAVSLLGAGLTRVAPALVQWSRASLIGKATGFLSATAVEALIFEITNQGVSRMQGQEPASFGKGYLQNFALIGAFKMLNLGMLKYVPKSANPSFMKQLKRASAEHLVHFTFFQTWSETMYRLENGDWPSGTERVQMMKDNALILGLVKVTLSATWPIPPEGIGSYSKQQISNLNRLFEQKKVELLDMYTHKADAKNITRGIDQLKELILKRQGYYRNLKNVSAIPEEHYKISEQWANDNMVALDHLKNIVKYDLKAVEGNELTYTYEGDAQSFKRFLEKLGLEETKPAGEPLNHEGVMRFNRNKFPEDTGVLTFIQKSKVSTPEAFKERTTAKKAIEAKGVDFKEGQLTLNSDGSTYLNTKLRLFVEYYNWTPAQGLESLPAAERNKLQLYFTIKALYPQVENTDAIAGLMKLSDTLPQILNDFPQLALDAEVLTEAGLAVWKHGQKKKATQTLLAEQERIVANRQALQDKLAALEVANPGITEQFYSDFEGAGDVRVFEEDLGLVESWKAASNLDVSLRKDLFVLETITRHIDDTGKTASKISAEILQSGSYNDWLVDHFVTYVKHGHKLSKKTIDDAFTHINNVKLNGEGNPTYNNTQGIVGTHNLYIFNSQTVANGGRIEIVNKTPTSISGIDIIEYKILAVDIKGNTTHGQYFANGKLFLKTTFDPIAFDPITMKSIGYEGYKYAIDNNNFDSPRFFSGISGKFPVAGHYKEVGNENVISTWWIEAK